MFLHIYFRNNNNITSNTYRSSFLTKNIIDKFFIWEKFL